MLNSEVGGDVLHRNAVDHDDVVPRAVGGGQKAPVSGCRVTVPLGRGRDRHLCGETHSISITIDARGTERPTQFQSSCWFQIKSQRKSCTEE